MHGQTEHLPADPGELAGGGVDGSEHPEKLFGPGDSLGVGFVEPVEFRGIGHAQRVEQQDDFGQVGPLDFRRGALRTVEMVALRPQAAAGARPGAPGAALALVGRGSADAFKEQGMDAAFRIVAGDAGQSGINNMPDAVDRDGGLGDIRGDDDLADRLRGEGRVLVFGTQFTVQWKQRKRLTDSLCPDLRDGRLDLTHARHEDEDVPGLAREDQIGHDLGGDLRGRAFIGSRQKADLDGEHLPFGDDDGTGAELRMGEVVGDGFGIQRGRHDDEPEVGPGRLLDALCEGERDVAEQAAFVEFVEDQHADVGQRGIILQPAEEDAFRDETKPRAVARAVVEPDLVADLAAQLRVPFPGDAGGERTCGHPSRLEDDDAFRSGHSRVEHHLRDLGRLAGARGRDEHEPAPFPRVAQDRVGDFPDREIVLGGHGRSAFEDDEAQHQCGDGEDDHHSGGHEFAALRQLHPEVDEQDTDDDVRHHGRKDAKGRQDERQGEEGRGDQGGLALALEVADEAAEFQQHDVDPEDDGRCHVAGSVRRTGDPRPAACRSFNPKGRPGSRSRRARFRRRPQMAGSRPRSP